MKNNKNQNLKLKIQNHSVKVKTDLKQRFYYFSIQVINFLKTLPEKKIYWVLSDQLFRWVTSISANIIEAKSASSKRDFIKFSEITLKSANKTKYPLNLLREATSASKEKINNLLAKARII